VLWACEEARPFDAWRMLQGRPSIQRLSLNVPRYEVTVQGRGIVVPMDTSLAVGFLRLVQVRAVDPVEAEVRAVELVRSDWCSSGYASQNRGGAPYLTIIRIGILSWWHRFLGSPSGYIFFAEDGVLMAPDPRRRAP
jgi:hypothetical protein